MAQEENQMGLISPKVAEPVWVALGIHDPLCCQGFNIEGHTRTYDGSARIGNSVK